MVKADRWENLPAKLGVSKGLAFLAKEALWDRGERNARHSWKNYRAKQYRPV